MALSTTQRRLTAEALQIARIVNTDFWDIQRHHKVARTGYLRLAINHMVVGEVVLQYALLDQILSELACRYFFKNKGKNWALWRQKRFRLFVNYLLDETYLLKKLDLVHAISPIPDNVMKIVRKVNTLRNAMAHSFFPEYRKEHRKVGKVLYGNKDIRSSAGLAQFKSECVIAWGYLAKRAGMPIQLR